jgi:integrase/recombinase XerD
MALHVQAYLLSLDDDAILYYLHQLKSKRKTPSDSFFKHTVYGLWYLFRIFNKQEIRVIRPSIERQKALPTVLSEQDIKTLLKASKLHNHAKN